MLTYTISPYERDYIEACYFEKNAKDSLLVMLVENKNIEVDSPIFERVYKEAVDSNIKFSACFGAIADRYIPKSIKYTDARIDFVDCALVVEEA